MEVALRGRQENESDEVKERLCSTHMPLHHSVPVDMALSSQDGSGIDHAANYNAMVRHSTNMLSSSENRQADARVQNIAVTRA